MAKTRWAHEGYEAALARAEAKPARTSMQDRGGPITREDTRRTSLAELRDIVHYRRLIRWAYSRSLIASLTAQQELAARWRVVLPLEAQRLLGGAGLRYVLCRCPRCGGRLVTGTCQRAGCRARWCETPAVSVR